MVTLQRILFTVMGAVWLAIGGAALAGVVTFGLERGGDIVGLLLIANGIAWIAAAWLTIRGRRWIDILAGLLIAQNAVFSLLDQVGVFDVIVFAVNCALLVLLIANAWRLSREE